MSSKLIFALGAMVVLLLAGYSKVAVLAGGGFIIAMALWQWLDEQKR